ncbi:hypothetical protein EIP86_008277 [Pleurotus ostreatoroseus]|nr:hypothetical protein EIP86_008277 [Pleurotus ostreatoroseus]
MFANVGSGSLKPFPNPSTSSADPSASLQTLWDYLSPALDYIMQHPIDNTVKAPTLPSSYHMGIHTAVYNYLTKQSDMADMKPRTSVAPTFLQWQNKTETGGTVLYKRLDQYFADASLHILLAVPDNENSLIHYLIHCFKRYSIGSRSVSRLLHYMNRHYVRRAVDEDKGWFQTADITDILNSLVEKFGMNVPSDQISKAVKERKTEELKKWGYKDGATAEQLALAEACAEAASQPTCVVPLTSLAHRRFRTTVIDALLAVEGAPKGKKKRNPAAAGRLALCKSRLGRATEHFLRDDNIDTKEKVRAVVELTKVLETVGIKANHPLRKKLETFVETHTTT